MRMTVVHAGILLAAALSGSAEAGELDRLSPLIETTMAKSGVPGASIALVRGCRIAQTKAWGKRDILSGDALQVDDVVQGASLGKPVAAFALLQTTGETGRLLLDEPIGRDAAERLAFRPAETGATVTVAQMLSHQTGLPNSPFPGTRNFAFAPGSSFRYSGLGFTALQEFYELRTDDTVEALSSRLVFDPLGMKRSSYVNSDGVWGHMRAGSLLGFAAAPFAGAAIVVGLLIAVVGRLRCKVWRFGPGAVVLASALGAIAATALFTQFMGLSALPTLIAVLGAVVAAAGLGAWIAARYLRFAGRAILGGALAAGLAAVLLGSLIVPIRTDLSGPTGNIAYSLSTTAPDLARFAIEVMQPTAPARERAARLLQTPRVDAPDGKKWGLGLGTHTAGGRTFRWQWGGNPGYGGILVMEPGRCDAVVVLTNGERGSEVARAAVQALLGIDTQWRV